MQSKEESFLDPNKEIEIDENIFMEFEKTESYDEASPIKMIPEKANKDLIAYRKKRNKKNRAAKKSRKINRKNRK